MTTKSSLPSILFGLAFSAAIATTSVSAGQNEIILHNAIDDYSGADIGTFESGLMSSRGRYDVNIVLDESYHEYRSEEVTAFQKDLGSLEQTEIAAFEDSSFNVPWEISVVD